MTLLPKSTIFSIALIALLVLILAVLAFLQYRWSGQVSEAAHERMQTGLMASMNQFRMQFNNELQQTAAPFQPGARILMQRDWKGYAENCSEALSGLDMHLVNEVYLWIAANDGTSKLLRLNRRAKEFEPIA